MPAKDEHHALTIICRALKPYIPDILDANGHPALDSLDRNIQWLFWHLEEQDNKTNPPPPKKRVDLFVSFLHDPENIAWHFALSPTELINGDFKIVDDLLFQVMNS